MISSVRNSGFTPIRSYWASDPITYQTDMKRAFKRLKGNLHQLFNIIR